MAYGPNDCNVNYLIEAQDKINSLTVENEALRAQLGGKSDQQKSVTMKKELEQLIKESSLEYAEERCKFPISLPKKEGGYEKVYPCGVTVSEDWTEGAEWMYKFIMGQPVNLEPGEISFRCLGHMCRFDVYFIGDALVCNGKVGNLEVEFTNILNDFHLRKMCIQSLMNK